MDSSLLRHDHTISIEEMFRKAVPLPSLDPFVKRQQIRIPRHYVVYKTGPIMAMVRLKTRIATYRCFVPFGEWGLRDHLLFGIDRLKVLEEKYVFEPAEIARVEKFFRW